MAGIQLSLDEYTALVSVALESAVASQERAMQFSDLISAINKRNGLQFHTLWVQWAERGEPLPLGASFPKSWPAKWRQRVDLFDRAPRRQDVLDVLQRFAVRPVDVMVTYDAAALVGWSRLDVAFPEAP